MSKPQSIYMWEKVDKTIQIIESQNDLILKTTDLYDPQYCSKYNEDCSFKSSHIIGEFVLMKKPFDFAYGFKSHCISINERFSKLEVCLHSIRKNKIKTFLPFGNELLSPSKIFPWQITLFYIHLNRRISVIMILDVSCQLVWCFMTSSWI